ncbi:MAG TPA: hydroxyphenylacetyl-CoA thioesterase PaaI, partial [Jiangellaceae bacterium]|nr:hydroxyphenylacetyl-CoA thioesterase PaaI [Jiangellaceae bacterium]
DATGGPAKKLVAFAQQAEPTEGWEIDSGDVVLRLTDGRTAAQHTGGGPKVVMLVDLALDFGSATRVGLAPPPQATRSQIDGAVALLQSLGFVVTIVPDTPGLVVGRTVAMLAAFAADAVDARVATSADVDTAMRLGVNYPRGPYEWGAALGWSWVVGVLDALAAAEDPVRYRVSPELRARVEGDATGAESTERAPEYTLAERSADAMWTDDAASQALGMTRLGVAPGRARFSMKVRPDMVNGHGICHGGLIFTLADTAFAFACNSYNRNTVAQSCDISFLTPARQGDVLIAVANERYRQGRNGVYDVTVYRADPGNDEIEGDIIAEFRGRSREIPGTLVEHDVEEESE